MIKKVIGLILVCIIFYLAIQALVFLPSITNMVIGPNKSPFQIGTDYVNQAASIYPTYDMNGKVVKNTTVYNTETETKIVGKITLEKNNGRLILSVESANPKTDLNIWLTNTPDVSSKTEYVDFGLLSKSESIIQYVIDMKGGDLSFAEYRYVLLVDTKSGNQVYAKINLK
ncbi:hypothetical protein H7X65_01460 [Candidatus Parcubacteria bacterium]|nr:hypothetical protein [Candidatus Parcubacteria bacterium]